jgi:hypothetical protein
MTVVSSPAGGMTVVSSPAGGMTVVGSPEGEKGCVVSTGRLIGSDNPAHKVQDWNRPEKSESVRKVHTTASQQRRARRTNGNRREELKE